MQTIKKIKVRNFVNDRGNAVPNQFIIETPEGLFRRVARTIAAPEQMYGSSPEEVKEVEDRFYNMMIGCECLNDYINIFFEIRQDIYN